LYKHNLFQDYDTVKTKTADYKNNVRVACDCCVIRRDKFLIYKLKPDVQWPGTENI